MIILENVVLSDDIKDEFFLCDLSVCKGACCVEGDSGAPLELEETLILEEIYDAVKSYLTADSISIIETKGLYEVDSDGDFCTTTNEKKECVFSRYNEIGILECGIEKAYKDGKTFFPKPISCHLYPIRITKTHIFDLVNYHRWDICSAACRNGQAKGIQLYKFLKDALIRKYSSEWYSMLVKAIEKI